MIEAIRTPSSASARAWLVGPLAAVVFWISLIGFAAVRTDGYTHGTKAVSELGSLDAPAAMAFNLLGFVLPGVLLVIFGLLLHRASGRRIGPLLLIGSGACLALAGAAPADMANPGATTTAWHIVGAMGSGLLWVPALFFCRPMLARDFGLRTWGRITPLFGVFAFANIAWQVAYQSGAPILPGWGQRLGFVGYFAWFAVTGWLLWRRARGLQERG